LIRGNGLLHSLFVFRAQVQSLGATIQVNRQELTAVTCAWILGTGAIWLPAPSQPLHDTAAHKGLEAQGSELLVKLSAAALGVSTIRSHV
jgi:hypothetical protein